MSTQSAAVRDWTYAEFARLPDDGNRYEVIAGELYVTPSPNPIHTRIAFKLAVLLEDFAAEHGLGWVTTAPTDVLFGPGDYVQPDVIFLRADKAGSVTDRGIEAAPDLVVEVLSPSTALRDRGLKRQRYGALGVREYWIVDPENRRIESYALAAAPGSLPRIATDAGDWQPVEGGPTLTIRLDDFMRGFDRAARPSPSSHEP